VFSITKLFSGFAFWKGEKFGKLLFYGIIVAMGLAVYHQITRPTQKITVEKGGKAEITNIMDSKKAFTELYIQADTSKSFEGGVRCGYRF